MIIPILCGDGSSAPPEWFLLELQGRVLPSASLAARGGALDGALMGRLDAAPSGGACRYQLQVGTYRMMGSLAPLAKPLLVLRRRPLAAADDESAMAEDDDDGGGDAPTAAAAAVVEYEVHAVIRRRFVFSERPQQMVGTARTGGLGGKEDVA